MDETTLKIAIASFMHDMGKFADKETLGVAEQYINDHAGLYLPFYNGRYSHHHAVYTAAFIERMEDVLPAQFNRPGWGEGDGFVNLAAGHHKPETPMQWAIAVADRVSSGWDRDTFDEEYNRQIAWKDYKKTRLLPIFEQLMVEGDGESDVIGMFSFRYPLKAVSPKTIFPGPREEIIPETIDEAAGQYKELFDEFVSALQSLKHWKNSLELWFEHFESLMMSYTSSIPAARAGNVVPDVSLYDHAKTTSALAVAIYLFHRHKESLTVEAIKNYEDKKFLIVSGDFYGIQEFIFSGYSDTRRYRSKLLRGRSFAVSLSTELAADMVCREIGIPSSSIILNAAGKFTVLAPNTNEARHAVEEVERRINDWLVKISYSESAIGLSLMEATCDDFVSGNFPDLWERTSQAMEEKKFSRTDLDRYGGAVDGYLDSFINTLQYPLCRLCGKRPSSSQAEGTSYVADAQSACNLCRDHIFLGTNLVKKTRLAVISPGVEIRGKENSLFEPIFGEYQVAFLEGDLGELVESRQLLKYWEMSIASDNMSPRDVTVKLISGYVPVYSKADEQDERLLTGAKSEEKKLELIEQIKIGDPKTFNHIACKGKNPTEKEGEFCGTEALGILKADVDQLGMLMACGLRPERFTLSRLATLSRQLHYYFALYLPDLLRKEPFCDIYTVFAGGDDLFLIGPWNRIIDLVSVLKNSFAQFVCHNSNIHFSAGISVHKPQTPLDTMAEASESALESSKSRGRNRLTIFDETVTWDELENLTRIKHTLSEWIEKGWLNRSMFYRLNGLIEMAGEEKRVVNNSEIHMDDMSCTKWRSLLAYTAERNVAKQIKGDARRLAIDEVTGLMAQWLTEYGARLKIALWYILYNIR